MSEKKRILVLAAHPDDEVLGVGGTIAKHVSNGNEVYIHILRNGIAERHANSAKNAETMRKLVENNAVQCAGVLGVPEQNVSFGNYSFNERFSCFHISDGKSVSTNIEKILEKIKPQIVYTNHYGDAHLDHKTVYEATMIATRTIGICNNGIERVLSYEVPSATEQTFQTTGFIFMPNVYENISDFIKVKIKAFLKYTTEQAKGSYHPRSPEKIHIKAESRGGEMNIYAAEAFCLLREIHL